MASQWITDVSNPGVPMNMDLVTSYKLDPTGLVIEFFTSSGGRVLWTFATTAVASTVLANIGTLVAPTAIAE